MTEPIEVLVCRLIIDPPTPGPRNMAVDEALLIDAAENGVASVRFYGWSEPTLSLGYFQKYNDRQTHAASRLCAIVRRQTGGGAILHDRELTYSITLPPSHMLARQSQQLYRAVHQEFVNALTEIGPADASRWRFQIRDQVEQQPYGEPFLCFQRQAEGDVVAVFEDAPPCKILGSAQRRFRGAVLQHGSLLLERSPAAPQLPGLRDLLGLSVAAGALAERMGARLGRWLSLTASRTELPPELESRASQLANSKYSSADWTNRR